MFLNTFLNSILPSLYISSYFPLALYNTCVIANVHLFIKYVCIECSIKWQVTPSIKVLSSRCCLLQEFQKGSFGRKTLNSVLDLDHTFFVSNPCQVALYWRYLPSWDLPDFLFHLLLAWALKSIFITSLFGQKLTPKHTIQTDTWIPALGTAPRASV